MKAETEKMDEIQFLNSNNKKKKFELLRYEQLPDYMKDNEYILNYYRADWSLKHAFFSLFLCHNETLNVWTAYMAIPNLGHLIFYPTWQHLVKVLSCDANHLIGFVAFLVLTIANLTECYQVADFLHVYKWVFPPDHSAHTSHQLMSSSMDTTPSLIEVTRWPLYVYLGGAMFCFVSSSVCHLFSCHTHHLNCRLSQLDYTGISVMIITSFFPPIYYLFLCNPVWQYVYLGIITVLGAFAIMVLLSPTRARGKYRFMRTLIFVTMGLFGVIPAIHATIMNWNVPQRNTALGFESAMGFSYLVGAIFYVSRVPEKLKPGWFDLVGHSHQIFHIFVVMGALAHYVSVLILYECRRRLSCE